jgi:hypothetical protein
MQQGAAVYLHVPTSGDCIVWLGRKQMILSLARLQAIPTRPDVSSISTATFRMKDRGILGKSWLWM